MMIAWKLWSKIGTPPARRRSSCGLGLLLCLILAQAPDLPLGLAQDTPPTPAKTQQNTADPTAASPAASGLFPVETTWESFDADTRRRIDQAVLRGYDAISATGSSDQVLIRQATRDTFLAECLRAWTESNPDAEVTTVDASLFVWRLLNQRKAGKLPPASGRPQLAPIQDDQRVIAEIASRRAEDAFRQSLDRILVDAQGRQRFAEYVREMAPNEDLDTIRRAALALRKARQLRPELSARLIDWPIEHRSYSVAELTNDWGAVPQQPGVYLFRDETGYLYVGEAKDLRARLQTHLQGSDRAALAQALQRETLNGIHLDLHIFPSDSPGATLAVRRAYESELIRSRQPRLNLRP